MTEHEPPDARTCVTDWPMPGSTCALTRAEKQGDLEQFLDAALGGGVDIVQLRQKDLEAADELAALEVFADACKRHGKLLAVNDRADIAFAAGADVLHLGQRDLPVQAARAITGLEPVIGRSTHTFSQVNAAVDEQGSDYFCVGPTWETPTKPGRSCRRTGARLVRRQPAVGKALVRHRRDRPRPAGPGGRGRREPGGRRTGHHRGGRPGRGGRGVQPAAAGCRVINNPKVARIIAAVVIAMLVITLAASLFGCSAASTTAAARLVRSDLQGRRA